MRRALVHAGSATAFITALAVSVVGASAAASRCQPMPGSTACLSPLFANNGAHFHSATWTKIVGMAGLGVTAKRFAALRAKWKGASAAQKVALNDWVNRVTLGPDFPKFAAALTVCRRFYGTNRDWKSYCSHWYHAQFFEVTGWQYSPTTGIAVYGMFYFSKLPSRVKGNMQGMVTDDGAIQLPIKFPEANAAWKAVDSPLPLIAFYDEVRRASSEAPRAGADSLVARKAMAAGQLLEFWGWTAPTVMAPQVWRIMKAAGFNPTAAGGPDVAPGADPPAWRSMFWSSRQLKAEWPDLRLETKPWGPDNPAPGFAGT